MARPHVAAEHAARAPSRWRIPFNRPAVVGTEMTHLRSVLESGHHSGDGPYSRRCEAILEGIVGAQRAFLTPSATDALEMAALLLDLGSGDDVVVPSFTFPSTANAFVLRGARPVFADIRPDTLNIDETKLGGLVGPRTRAIFVVHYAGVSCEMAPIAELAAERGIAIVEDDAQGLFATYRGRPLGSFGAFAALSFHETKNISCGEGGALLVNDERYVQRAEIVREKGTDRARFSRREVDKYTWVDVGSSFLASELQAAVLFAQLEARDAIQSRRCALWDKYRSELSGWAARHGVAMPVVPADRTQPCHIFYLIAPTAEARTRLIAHLAERGILAPFHYVPLHLSRMGRAAGGSPGQCPVTERVSERLLRLPLYYGLGDDEQDEVIDAVRAFAL
jgi:dTDP-4-amino-4,6-dideoxygalactose transaminase